MEEKVVEAPLMSEEKFKEYLRNTLNLQYFGCVSKFKSVKRAFKRGHITNYGYIVPRKPFNNRKHTAGRSMNIEKKRIYEKLTEKKVLW